MFAAIVLIVVVFGFAAATAIGGLTFVKHDLIAGRLRQERSLLVYYDDRAKRVMYLANEEAKQWQEAEIGVEHVLLAIVKEDSAIASRVLGNFGIEYDVLKQEFEKIFGECPGDDSNVPIDLPSKTTTISMMRNAVEHARKLDYNSVGPEHLLLSIMDEEYCIASVVLSCLATTLCLQKNAEALAAIDHDAPDLDSMDDPPSEEDWKRMDEHMERMASLNLSTPVGLKEIREQLLAQMKSR